MDFVIELADELARDAMQAEIDLDDERLVDQLSTTIGAVSQTLQEAFMTSIRIRRAEKMARKFLATRIAKAKAGQG